MKDFTYDEMKMIKSALYTEICRREENRYANLEMLNKFEDLCDKVCDMIKEMEDCN